MEMDATKIYVIDNAGRNCVPKRYLMINGEHIATTRPMLIIGVIDFLKCRHKAISACVRDIEETFGKFTCIKDEEIPVWPIATAIAAE